MGESEAPTPVAPSLNGHGGGPNAERVAWLELAYEALRRDILTTAPPVEAVNVTCGFPSRGARSRTKKVVGECFHGFEETEAPTFISLHPKVFKDPIEVLATLLHEAIHATLPPKSGHGPRFAAAAKEAGLEGPPTATVPGEALKVRLNAILKALPPMPKGWGDMTSKPAAGSRLRLYECSCGVKVRVASDEFLAMCKECDDDFEGPL